MDLKLLCKLCGRHKKCFFEDNNLVCRKFLNVVSQHFEQKRKGEQ